MTVDVEKSDKLIRLLDTVVIKLEGGTDEDLKELDEPTPAENNKEKPGGTLLMHCFGIEFIDKTKY